MIIGSAKLDILIEMKNKKENKDSLLLLSSPRYCSLGVACSPNPQKQTIFIFFFNT